MSLSDRVPDSVMRLAKCGRNDRSETAIAAKTMIHHRWTERLRAAGCTQIELADEIGITERTLNNYVCGRRTASEDIAIRADAAVLRIRERRGLIRRSAAG